MWKIVTVSVWVAWYGLWRFFWTTAPHYAVPGLGEVKRSCLYFPGRPSSFTQVYTSKYLQYFTVIAATQSYRAWIKHACLKKTDSIGICITMWWLAHHESMIFVPVSNFVHLKGISGKLWARNRLFRVQRLEKKIPQHESSRTNIRTEVASVGTGVWPTLFAAFWLIFFFFVQK